MVILVIFENRLEWDQIVLTADIKHVVNSPVHMPDSPSRMPQPLDHVHQHNSWANWQSYCFDGFQYGIDYVRASLENVGPDVVQQMYKRVLVPETLDAKCQMLYRSRSSLSMDQISISEGILE